MASKKPDIKLALPGQDKDIRLLSKRTIDFTYDSPANLIGIVASVDDRQVLELLKFMRFYRKYKTANKCIVIPSLPVVVKNYSFQGRLTMASGKAILSGAAALRTLMKAFKKGKGDSGVEKLESMAARARKKSDIKFPTAPGNNDILQAPFVIEAKNFFNYYHFTTETLIYLQMYKDYDMQGPIHIITGSQAEHKKFVSAAIQDFYPELKDRISFHRGRLSEDQAILPFNANFQYHISSLLPDIEKQAEFSEISNNGALRPVTIDNYKLIYNNSRDEYIDRHRANALKHSVVPTDSKRIYVGRKPGAGKPRDLVGEDKMKKMLQRYGFQNVYLEDLSPKEQAGLCNQVDIFVSAHGAGFANMMYAKPNAYFVELSHLQNGRHRFGDFNMHAAVSGAKYIHLFADHSDAEGSEVPSMKQDGHSGILMSDFAIDRLEGLIAIISDIRAYRSFFHQIDEHLKKGDYQAVLSTFGTSPQYALGCPRVCAVVSEAHLLAGDGSAAISYLKQALKLAPFRKDIAKRLIEIASELGDDREVKAAQEHSEQFNPFSWMRWTRDASGGIIIQPNKKKAG